MPNFNVVNTKPKPAKVASPAIETASKDSKWQPGFRQTPWPAMVLAFIMLACMGASASVITVSNKQTVQSWKIGPSVLLALLSAIWNYALSALLGICVVVTWWRSALDGTTLESLHYIWNQTGGLNFFSSLLSAKARKVVLLAWLVALAQIVNGPLLQRSTRVVSESLVIEDNMTLAISRHLRNGWIGWVVNATTGDIIGSRDGIGAAQGWWKNTTILTTSNNTGSDCNGTCEGTVQGTGIAYTCTSTLRELDLTQPENDGATLFEISTTMSTNATGAPVLVLTTVYASAVDSSCIASLNISSCFIEAAIVEYPIIIQNTTVSLDMDKLDSAPIVEIFVYEGDLPSAPKYYSAGPLTGLANSFGSYLFSNSTMQVLPNTTIYNNMQGGLIPDLFFVFDVADYDPSTVGKCDLAWSSPNQFVLNAMSDWLFRASISSSWPTDTQTFSVRRTNSALIFLSEYRYFALALVIMSITLLGVVFQLWGFWRLGRHVTMSPLELAKAFKAPLVEQASHSSAIDGILKAVGKTNVKYDGESFYADTETKSVLRVRGRK